MSVRVRAGLTLDLEAIDLLGTVGTTDRLRASLQSSSEVARIASSRPVIAATEIIGFTRFTNFITSLAYHRAP